MALGRWKPLARSAGAALTLPEIPSRVPAKPDKEGLGARCMSFVRDHGVPEELLATLDECAYAGWIQIGRLRLSALAELDRENSEEENAPCIEHGFLILGSGLNGDPIAIELATRNMAFISHDILWERDYERFEECVVRTPLGLHDFWTQAAEDPDSPSTPTTRNASGADS